MAEGVRLDVGRTLGGVTARPLGVSLASRVCVWVVSDATSGACCPTIRKAGASRITHSKARSATLPAITHGAAREVINRTAGLTSPCGSFTLHCASCRESKHPTARRLHVACMRATHRATA